MRPGYQLRRVLDVAGSLRLARQGAAADRCPRERLRALQRDRLRLLVRHAVAHAPWHRERLATALQGGDDVELASLPQMDKQSLMAHFDDAVCDPRLTIAVLDAHTAHLHRDELLFGEYRVATTGGTSGVKAYFCFSRSAWRASMASFPRCAVALGFSPRLPRFKIAQVTASGPLHLTHRLATTVDLGLYRTLRLDVVAAIDSLATALHSFQPDCLTGYPSILALLADEQIEGRLGIHPRRCVVTAEQCTSDMRRRIEQAWGHEPFDAYATTETGGPLAFECSAHQGMHLFEDRVIVEVIDADGRPVPDGTPGQSVLLTTLDNLVQPIIRYKLDDLLTVNAGPCPCGRTTRRIVALEGRAGDIIRLRAADGTPIPVHPNHFEEPIEEQPWVRQYQVVHRPGDLEILIVAREGGVDGAPALEAQLERRLRDLGVAPPPIRIRLTDAIPRAQGVGAKHKLVRSEGDPD